MLNLINVVCSLELNVNKYYMCTVSIIKITNNAWLLVGWFCQQSTGRACDGSVSLQVCVHYWSGHSHSTGNFVGATSDLALPQ